MLRIDESWYDKKTIVACCSPEGCGAVSLIRLSGPFALNDFSPLLKTFTALETVKTRKATLAQVLSREGEILDEVLLTYFKAPHSYTGENVIELGVHGNPINVQKIIDSFLSFPFVRMARPGEFSFRAFKNQKLSLAEVEGLNLLLNAQNNWALSEGRDLLIGKRREDYIRLRDSFTQLKASFEIMLDFSADVTDEDSQKYQNDCFYQFKAELQPLVEKAKIDALPLYNPSIVLVGPVNAGKSTLFNHLLGEERAIVSSVQGTTRDFIAEQIHFEKYSFRLIDTAGIRHADDLVEREGIRRSQKLKEEAFFKILLIPAHSWKESSLNYLFSDFDLILISHIDQMEEKKELQVECLKVETPVYMGDLRSGSIEPLQTGSIEPEKNGPIEPPDRKRIGSIGPARLKKNPSDRTGILPLKEVIGNLVEKKYQKSISAKPVAVERHRSILKQISQEFQRFTLLRETEDDLAILASSLNEIEVLLSDLIGVISPDKVLSTIFSSFCIGK